MLNSIIIASNKSTELRDKLNNFMNSLNTIVMGEKLEIVSVTQSESICLTVLGQTYWHGTIVIIYQNIKIMK